MVVCDLFLFTNFYLIFLYILLKMLFYYFCFFWLFFFIFVVCLSFVTLLNRNGYAHHRFFPYPQTVFFFVCEWQMSGTKIDRCLFDEERKNRFYAHFFHNIFVFMQLHLVERLCSSSVNEFKFLDRLLL